MHNTDLGLHGLKIMGLMEESVICGIRGDHAEVRNVSSSGLQGTDEGRDHANAIFTTIQTWVCMVLRLWSSWRNRSAVASGGIILK